MRHERYKALNDKYLEDGALLLERRDYPQASEKFWGAAAQGIKSIAALRRWRHGSHRDLRTVIERLYGETDDEELPRLFSVAEALHANFYENYMSGEVVRLHAGDVRRLVAKLEALAA